MSLGSYIREIRQSRNLSLRDVERSAKEKNLKTDLSSGYVSLLERDEVKEPSPRILYALASIYGIDYIDLMKKAGYIPESTSAGEHTPAQVAFRGAFNLSEEQKTRVQHYIDLELGDSMNSKRKKKE